MSVHIGGFKSTAVCQEVFISIGRPFKEKSISVSTVKKKHMRCRTYRYTAALMQEILNIETLTQPHNLPW